MLKINHKLKLLEKKMKNKPLERTVQNFIFFSNEFLKEIELLGIEDFLENQKKKTLLLLKPTDNSKENEKNISEDRRTFPQMNRKIQDKKSIVLTQNEYFKE